MLDVYPREVNYEWHHYINPQQDLSFWSSYKLVIFQSLQIFFKHFGVTIVSINAIFLKKFAGILLLNIYSISIVEISKF
jgi:hypothetical protein